MNSFILLLNDMFKVNKNVWVKIMKSKITYSVINNLLFYICIPLNKPADDFLSILITESIVMQAMPV